MDTFLYEFPAIELPSKVDSTELIVEQLDREYKFSAIAPEVNNLVKAMREGRTSEGIAAFVNKAMKVGGKAKANVENLYMTAGRRLQKYKDAVKNPQKTLTYGFEQVDAITGGMWKSDLIIIAGRAGEGKTQIAIESARQVSQQGFKVAFFNGEMDNDELGYRLDTLETHVSNFCISNGKPCVEMQYIEAIPTIINKKNELLVLSRPEDIDEKITPSYLYRYCQQNAIDVLYVDQFSLLDGESRYRTDQEVSYELVRDIKKMQKRLGIPVVLLAQIKRPDKTAKTKEGDPKYELSDLGKTRALEEFASVVIMLDQLFEKDENGRAIINFYIGKNRHGVKNNTLTYAFDIDKGYITFLKSTMPLPKYTKVSSNVDIAPTLIETQVEEGNLPFNDGGAEAVDEDSLPY